jgi:hypothetical protein
MRRLALLAALLLTSCGGLAASRRISYANVQTLNPGVDGRWVLEEFPEPSGVDRGPDGRIQRLSYGVTDPQGKPQTLNLWFDEHEVLQRKDYSGRVLRPLPTSAPGRPPPVVNRPPPSTR